MAGAKTKTDTKKLIEAVPFGAAFFYAISGAVFIFEFGSAKKIAHGFSRMRRICSGNQHEPAAPAKIHMPSFPFQELPEAFNFAAHWPKPSKTKILHLETIRQNRPPHCTRPPD